MSDVEPILPRRSCREYSIAMAQFGYTMMCEQSRPDRLVEDVRRAEAAGFDFSVISDHFSPWLEAQGHSGYAWSILGAAAQATERIPLMTYVTCPILRYHPAVVAQKAATMQILSGGRFRLGLGAGENLNEHVVGKRWPAVGERHEMFAEAVEIIGGCSTANTSTIAASTSASSPHASSTCRRRGRRSGSRCPAASRARSRAGTPT
jgi:G6PDH family F420-dependent oxidoreductase